MNWPKLLSFLLLLTGTGLLRSAEFVPPPEQDRNQTIAFLESNIDRPLRYFPEGRDFVITNGGEFFNRPLYSANAPFRVDAGDQPEFSLYLPGRGGNLRFGLSTPAGAKWLHECETVIARYCPGAMLYEIRDRTLGAGEPARVAQCGGSGCSSASSGGCSRRSWRGQLRFSGPWVARSLP